ncbi:MAG: branched-chain amino acid ABC transporter substrate-binding protein [Pseudomonadota bacterium]
MSEKTRIKILLAGLLLVCTAAARAEITMALAAPLSGSEMELGLDIRAGAEVAVAEINAAGGVLGEPLKLELVDDLCDRREGAIKANEIGRRGIPVVLGHACSGAAVPASLVYEEDGVLMMSASSSVPRLTERGLSLTFRLFGRDDRLAETIAKHVIQNFSEKRIAVAHDNRGYGKGVADSFKDELNKQNIKEVAYESLGSGEVGTAVLLTQLRALKAEVVFFGGYFKDMARLVREAGAMGYHPVFVTAEAASRATFWDVAGPAAEGVLYGTLASLADSPEVKAINQAIEARQRRPNLYGLSSYAAVKIWAAAAGTAQTTEAAVVAQVLREHKYPSPLGEIQFDSRGDAKGISYQIFRWSQGLSGPVLEGQP